MLFGSPAASEKICSGPKVDIDIDIDTYKDKASSDSTEQPSFVLITLPFLYKLSENKDSHFESWHVVLGNGQLHDSVTVP